MDEVSLLLIQNLCERLHVEGADSTETPGKHGTFPPQGSKGLWSALSVPPHTTTRVVVPKLGAMAPQGAMGLLPGSHGRILKKYIFQGLILKYGLFDFLEFFTH